MCRRGKREHAMALDTLKDLFDSDLLPERKLLYFHQQPLHLLAGLKGSDADRYDRCAALCSRSSLLLYDRSLRPVRGVLALV
jgi:hypothetical protein